MKNSQQNNPCRLPRRHMGNNSDMRPSKKKGARNHGVGRYPGWRNALQRLPRRLFKAPSGMCVEGESQVIRPLTVAGAAQAGWRHVWHDLPASR